MKILVAIAGLTLAATAFAHHGFGRFDRSQPVTIEGTITGVDFVNPHSYLNLEVVDSATGDTVAMRCEMRAATLLRRSGWSEAMFVTGARATIEGFGHRDDPASCYLEDIRIGDAAAVNRNDQFATGAGPELANRPYRLASGEVNLSGDWAQEQYVIAVPPDGPGNLVPKSMKPGIESGELSMDDVPPAGWNARPVSYTERGRAEAESFEMWSPADNPRLRCEPTSILFDWTFDGAVNRITQAGDRIVIDYGLYSFERVIHMNLDSHPEDIEPHYAGHSIGHWEGDVLVVDTVGFAPGVIAPPLRNSTELHVIERFRLDPETLELRRDYVARDPVYFTDEYSGYDVVLPADVPYVAHPCDELAPEFIEAPVAGR